MPRGIRKPTGDAIFHPLMHPLCFAESGKFAFPPLYQWQTDIINEVSKPRSRVCVSTCNESGKTNILIPLMGLSAMCAFPGCTIFSTAGVEEQIRGQLFKYLEAKLRPYTKPGGWNVSVSDLEIRAPAINGLRSRWIARAPKDANSVEGYHGHWERDDKGNEVWCPVAVVIDEAKSVVREIFEAAARIDPDWLFVISTFDKDEGPFYEAMEDLINKDATEGIKGNNKSLWTYRRMINWLMCPHLLTPGKMEFRQAMIEKYGENSSFIKSFLGGECKRDTDENYVFLEHDIRNVNRAMGRQVADERIGNVPTHDGNRRAGIEFSGGGDEQMIYVRNGTEVIFDQAFRENNTVKLASIFVGILLRLGVQPYNCYADNGGLGLAVIDYMENMGYQGIHRYMNQQQPFNRSEYADRMTENHYQFKEILRLYPVKFRDDPVLLKQFRQRRFKSDDHNRIKLEQKTIHRGRTGESPDRLDAMIMCWSDFVPPPQSAPPPTEYVSEINDKATQFKGGSGAFGGLLPQMGLQRLRQLAENNA